MTYTSLGGNSLVGCPELVEGQGPGFSEPHSKSGPGQTDGRTTRLITITCGWLANNFILLLLLAYYTEEFDFLSDLESTGSSAGSTRCEAGCELGLVAVDQLIDCSCARMYTALLYIYIHIIYLPFQRIFNRNKQTKHRVGM